MDNLVHIGGAKVHKKSSTLAINGTKSLFLSLASLIFLLTCGQTMAAAGFAGLNDDVGRTVALSAPAVRIVCLSEAHAENIVAIRAFKQLAGVAFSTDPKWVNNKIPRLSKNPSKEQIISMQPDMVLFETEWAQKNKPLLKELDAAKISYAVISRPKWGRFGTYLEKLGSICGRPRDASKAQISLERSLQKAKLMADNLLGRRPRVFVVAGADFSSCASDSWGARLIEAVGGISAAGSDCQRITRDPQFVFYGPQKLALTGKDIDVIITLTGNTRGVPAVSRGAIMKDARFKDIPAVKNGRVWEMKEDDLMLPSLIRLDSSLAACFKSLMPVKNKK